MRKEFLRLALGAMVAGYEPAAVLTALSTTLSDLVVALRRDDVVRLDLRDSFAKMFSRSIEQSYDSPLVLEMRKTILEIRSNKP